MTFDPARHHRRSIRLKGYDYARAGAYFVTLCIYRRECLLGDVINGEMVLNEFGRAVCDHWEWIPKQYPHVDLDEWIVMPNHMHGIIVMVDDDCRGDSRIAPTRIAPTRIAPTRIAPTRTAPTRTAPTVKRKPLGRLVGAFKTVSAKHINRLRRTPGAPFWQRNYHERIIRDEDELNHIRWYIVNNPLRWNRDADHPAG